jgi:hypothetical protein
MMVFELFSDDTPTFVLDVLLHIHSASKIARRERYRPVAPIFVSPSVNIKFTYKARAESPVASDTAQLLPFLFYRQ